MGTVIAHKHPLQWHPCAAEQNGSAAMLNNALFLGGTIDLDEHVIAAFAALGHRRATIRHTATHWRLNALVGVNLLVVRHGDTCREHTWDVTGKWHLRVLTAELNAKQARRN